MNDIEIRQFRCFVALAEEKHFGAATFRLGIARPTLTREIKKLESELGVKLLVRQGNNEVVVTEAGQRFLAGAREVLRQVEQTAAAARQAVREELGPIELGVVASLFTAGLLHKWIAPFQQANPAIDISLHTLSPMAQLSGIVDKQINAGFGRMPQKYPLGVRGFELCRQPMALALPSEHPLTRHEAISPAMLADEAFVCLATEPHWGFFGYTETIAYIGNFVPRVARRSDDLITVLTYVALGHGIAVVPGLAKTMDWVGGVYRDIAADPAPDTSIGVLYGGDPSPPTKLLIQHMQRHALRHHGNGSAPPPNGSAKQNGFPKLAFSRPKS
jgi:DNA-binding transcriptional LysR family regulator